MLDVGLKKPKINIHQLKLTDHAIKRLRERLNIKDTTYGLKVVKDIVNNGEYLGEHFSGDSFDNYKYDDKCSMFVGKGTMVVVNNKTFDVVTVMQKEDHTYFHDKLKQQYIKLGSKEIRKLNRREQTLHKRLEEFKLDYDVQMALLNKRMYRTRSRNVITECKKSKEILDRQINCIKEDIRQVQVEKRKVAYSLSVFL
jgi:hypothetical protein